MQAANSLSIPQFYFAFRVSRCQKLDLTLMNFYADLSCFNQDKTKLHFVMEYVRNGTLYDHLCKGRAMPIALIRHFGA